MIEIIELYDKFYFQYCVNCVNKYQKICNQTIEDINKCYKQMKNGEKII